MDGTHGNPPVVGGSEIKRLVTSAEQDGQADAYAGKRGSVRFAAGMPLDVTTSPDVPSCAWPVTMHNISERGFAFWSRRQLRQGTAIYVREFSGNAPAPWLPACVTHCTVGIKGFLIGAAFDDPPA